MEEMNAFRLMYALSENETQARALAEERKTILAALEATVLLGETVSAAGYQASWKPGRKSTDHESAAKAAAVDAAIIERHTTVKASIAWAKVTKDAKIPKSVLDQYTTEAPPAFVVEPIK